MYQRLPAHLFPHLWDCQSAARQLFLFDHQHLAYLNIIEKFDCLYCSYAVGLLAYALEITARTEQYFCPIKHARKMLNAHARYDRFLGYGEADDFHTKLEEYRAALANEALQTERHKVG